MPLPVSVRALVPLLRLVAVLAFLVCGASFGQKNPKDDCPKTIVGFPQSLVQYHNSRYEDGGSSSRLSITAGGNLTFDLVHPTPFLEGKIGQTALNHINAISYYGNQVELLSAGHKFPLMDAVAGHLAGEPVTPPDPWGPLNALKARNCKPDNETGCPADPLCAVCTPLYINTGTGSVTRCACGVEVGGNPISGHGVARLPNVVHRPNMGSGGGGAFEFSAPGRGERFYQFLNQSYHPTSSFPAAELRYQDGTILQYEMYTGVDTQRYNYRTKHIIDPHDNKITFTYQSTSNYLETIQYPNGILERWTYIVDWAPSSVHSLINVEYDFVPGVAADPSLDLDQFKWSMLFKKEGGAYPFAGHTLFRVFYPKSQFLANPASFLDPYALSPINSYTVFEFEYETKPVTVGSQQYSVPLLSNIKQYRAENVTHSGLLGGVTTFAVTYESTFPYRVQSQTLPYLDAMSLSFSYTVVNGKVTEIRETDLLQNKRTVRMDAMGRPYEIELEAGDNASGRPRKYEDAATKAALAPHHADEPASIKWIYAYGGSCSSCPKPTSITDPSGRVTRYEYDPNTGYVSKVTVPNPAYGQPGEPATVDYTFTYNKAGLPNEYSAYELIATSGPDGQWNLTYEWTQRVDPAHGYKVQKVTRTSPQVTREEGAPEQVSAETLFDVSAPPLPGSGPLLVGQTLHQIDGNGVKRAASYNYYGFARESVANPNGTSDHQVKVSPTHDAFGRLRSLTVNDDSALENLFSVNTTTSGLSLGGSTSVSGVNIEEVVYRDRWGNVAVRLRTNKTSTGGRPAKHGALTQDARDWIRDDFHWTGPRLLASHVDRRPLDRNDDGTFSDHEDARRASRYYVYRADGELVQISESNDSDTILSIDGYGTLYKAMRKYTPQQGPEKSVLLGRYYTNLSLEVTKAHRGDTTLQLWTLIERNLSGEIMRITEPSMAQAPQGYTGSLGGAVHEFRYDRSGRVTQEEVLDGANVVARTRNVYDEIGRLRRSEDDVLGAGSGTLITRNVYSKATLLTKVIGAANRFVQYEYEAGGLSRLTKVLDSNGTSPNEKSVSYVAKTYVPQEVKARVYDAKGDSGSGAYVEYVTHLTHDVLGRLLEVQNRGKDGTQTPLRHRFTYYTTGMTETYTDPLDRVEKYLTDAFGRLVERVKLGSGSDFIRNKASYFDWTASGDGRTRVEQRDHLDHLTETSFDFAGRAFHLRKPGANFSYEPTTTQPYAKFSVLATYDAASRLTNRYEGVTDTPPSPPDPNAGLHIQYHYDGPGRLLVRESPTAHNLQDVSPLATRDVYSRDKLGRILSMGSFMGQIGPTMSWTTLEAFERDSLGRTHKEQFWYATGGSNAIDVASSFTGADSFRTGLTYSTGLDLDFTPDPIGRLATIQWTPPGSGQSLLAEYLYVGGAATSRTLHYSSTVRGQTEHGFDAYGRLKFIDDAVVGGAHAGPLSRFDYEYDAVGSLKKEIYKKQGTSDPLGGDRFTYDSYHRLKDAWMGVDAATMAKPEASLDEATDTYVQKLTYNHDGAQNRASVVTRNGPSGSPVAETYTLQGSSHPQGPSNRYDAVGATAVFHDYRGNVVWDGQFYYKYDYMNRLSEVYILTVEGSASSSEQSRYLRRSIRSRDIPGLESSRQKILSNVDSLLDAMKNHGKPGFADKLKAKVELSTQTRSSLQESSTASLVLWCMYTYDGFERRTIRAITGVNNYMHAWDGWQEVEECVAVVEQSVVFTRAAKQFVWGDGLDDLLAYRVQGSGGYWDTYYIGQGGAYCPVRVLDAAGQVKEVQEYDPYGRTTYWRDGAAYGSSGYGNPFAWKGLRLDPETGLVYMRHRYYSARLGRFLSRDWIGQFGDPGNLGNAYAYGWNSPLIRTDPLGLQVVAWIGGAGDQKTGIMSRAMDRYKGDNGAHRHFEWTDARRESSTSITRWAKKEYQSQSELQSLMAAVVDVRTDVSRGEWQKGPSATDGVPSPEVVLIGHSYGGDAALDAANLLADDGIPVNFIITLDGVGMRSPRRDRATWINVYDRQTLNDCVPMPIGALASIIQFVVTAPIRELDIADVGPNLSDVLATAGNQFGSQDDANINVELAAHHGEAPKFLDAALDASVTGGGLRITVAEVLSHIFR